MIDIGNSHVIDYYLCRALISRTVAAWYARGAEDWALHKALTWQGIDFDIETEQREGWAYD